MQVIRTSAILFLFLISQLDFYGQKKFIPGQYGLIEDPAFVEIIKKRNYDRIGAFERIDSINQLYIAKCYRKNNAGLIDNSGKEILPPKFEEYYLMDYSNPNRMVVRDTDAYFNIIDKKGKRLLERGVFMDMSGFKNGLSTFRTDNSEYSGVIDSSGRILIVTARVSEQSKEGVVTEDFKTKSPTLQKIKAMGLNYESVEVFNENYFLVRKNGNKGIIDRLGNVKLPFIYSDITILDEFSIIAQSGNNKHLLNQNLKPVTTLKFTDLDYIYRGNERLFIVMTYGGSDVYSGVFDRNGKELVKYGHYTISYDDPDRGKERQINTVLAEHNGSIAIVPLINAPAVWQFKYKHSFYKRASNYYFVGKMNEVIQVNELSLKSKVMPFHSYELIGLDTASNRWQYFDKQDVFVQMKKNRLYRIVDPAGNPRSDFIYESCDLYWFSSGFIPIGQGKKIGVLDTSGRIIFPFDSNIVDRYKPGDLPFLILYRGTDIKNKKPFAINLITGEQVIPPGFDEFILFNSETHFAAKKGNEFRVYTFKTGIPTAGKYSLIKTTGHKDYLYAENALGKFILNSEGKELIEVKNPTKLYDPVFVYNVVHFNYQ